MIRKREPSNDFPYIILLYSILQVCVKAEERGQTNYSCMQPWLWNSSLTSDHKTTEEFYTEPSTIMLTTPTDVTCVWRMGSITNDYVDIDMLKTGNITFSKTPTVYQKDEYYRIEECKYGANLHEMKCQIYKELLDILSNTYKVVSKMQLKGLERHSSKNN